MASDLQILKAPKLSQDHGAEGGLHLGRFVSVLKRHFLLIAGVTTLTAAAAVIKTVTDTPIYQAEFELSTPPVTLENQIISAINPDALSNQTEKLDTGLLDETKLKILTSPRVMEPTVADLKKIYPTLTYGEVVNQLSITPNAAGKILTVQYRNADVQKVSDVLDSVAEAYLEYSLKDRQNDIDRGIDFVDQQLPAVRDRVNELEAQLESLRQGSNLIDPLLQGEQLSSQMAAFTAEQLNLRVQIEQSYKIYQDLQRSLNEGEEGASTSALLESDRYQALLNQLLAVDSQLASDLTLYLEDSPEIEVLEEQRSNLKPLLEKEGLRVQVQVASVIRDLEARDQALSNSISTLNNRVKNLSSVTRQYNSIQRDLEIAATNLNQFLTKREALRIDAAQRRTPWEILTLPSTPQATAANAKLNLVLGSCLGLLLGAGIALLVDRTGNKIHTVQDLKEATLVPLLGTIPFHRSLEKERSALWPDDHSENPELISNIQNFLSAHFFESFKILATNIKLNNPDVPIKALTVSSAISGVGKSTVSYYLAHAFAAMGQRTLLVDTDLRRPSLHEFGNHSNSRGLSNYICGDLDLEDIVVDLPIDKNLFLVPSGPVPPDPARVLSSKRMETFLNRAYADFDMVIFDTPPLLGFADAFMIVRRTQGLLLATRLSLVKFSQLQTVFDELETAKVPMIGLVANGSREENDMYRTSHKYYHQTLEEGNGFIAAANNLN